VLESSLKGRQWLDERFGNGVVLSDSSTQRTNRAKPAGNRNRCPTRRANLFIFLSHGLSGTESLFADGIYPFVSKPVSAWTMAGSLPLSKAFTLESAKGCQQQEQHLATMPWVPHLDRSAVALAKAEGAATLLSAICHLSSRRRRAVIAPEVRRDSAFRSDQSFAESVNFFVDGSRISHRACHFFS
jgi:hypothetical protein